MNNVEIRNNQSDAAESLIADITKKVEELKKLSDSENMPDCITIANNIIQGQKNKGAVRVRLFHIGVDNGVKHPTSIAFDIALGSEERVNLTADTACFEVRPVIEGASYAGDEEPMHDIFGLKDAYEKLRAAVKAVPAIRDDHSIPDLERDVKAAAAWAEALRLAQQ